MSQWNSQIYGTFRNRKFTDIYPNNEVWYSDFKSNPIASTIELDDKTINLIYYLLYAKYGNSTIAAADENRFKYRLYSIIYSYGPTWAKKLEIQKKLRTTTIKELSIGAKMIYNHAANPSTPPSTSTLEELQQIDDQSTNTSKKGILEAYATLLNLLENDLAERFLEKFKNLFLIIVMPEEPLLYEED